MAKAGGNNTTARISYSRAKALASEYLGDSEFVESELLKELAAGAIPWRCARFETSQEYSGPGPGDPKFWKIDSDSRDGPVAIFRLRGVSIKGDSATRFDGAAAYGIELDRSALVRLRLLPPHNIDGEGDKTPPRQRQAETRAAKTLIRVEVQRRVAEGERFDRITDLSRNLYEWMKTVSDRPLEPRSIENILRNNGLWPLPPKK